METALERWLKTGRIGDEKRGQVAQGTRSTMLTTKTTTGFSSSNSNFGGSFTRIKA